MLSAEQLKLIPGVSQRAGELGVRVHIWLVGPSFAGNSLETQSLRTLAEATGGKPVHLLGGGKAAGAYPPTWNPCAVFTGWITPRASMPAGATASPSFTPRRDETTSSAEFPLELTVLPPNPVLLSLPGAITRAETRVSDQNKYLLIPLNQPILVAVEFPDGHERKLASSRLFVDGELVQENRMEPFNQFTWDLTPYEESGSHTLRVEVTDTLGLSRSTISTPVELEVQYRPSLACPRQPGSPVHPVRHPAGNRCPGDDTDIS